MTAAAHRDRVPADSHDLIRIEGARENNLHDVRVSIPKRRLTVFTGLSGSGKSSLVFDTIAAESRRMFDETYSAFVQGFMPQVSRPDADLLEGLTPAIIVDQERLGGGPRSTLGTITDAGTHLRTLFARRAEPAAGGPSAYSFNVPSATASGAITVQRGDRTIAEKTTFSQVGGMCPRCEGTGDVTDLDHEELFDDTRTLSQDPFTIPGYTGEGWNVRLIKESGFVPTDVPIRDFTTRQRHDFLYKEPTKVRIGGTNLTYEGLIPRIQKSMLSKERSTMQTHIRAFVDRAVTYITCPDCEGTRLAAHARRAKIDGRSIADVSALPITELRDWVLGLDARGIQPLVASLGGLLDAFVEIGLGYLAMDRPSATLSGGEAQRAKLVTHLGSSLTDVTYVFDEPTVGLHPRDIDRMNTQLLALRDKGNTVLVVEHRVETIAVADHVVDLGPGAGADGGRITFEGSVDELRTSNTATGVALDEKVELKKDPRTPTGALAIRGARLHNLQDVDVDLPLGVLTVVTGVAGSGKSSLIHGCMPPDADATVIDQRPIRGSRRSNPATYTGLLDPIRKAFAKANGVKAALFSPNSEGACPTCKGAGVIFTELGFLETVTTVCEDCEGRRFEPSVLEHHLGGKDIAEVLEMSVAGALTFFSGDLEGAAEARIPAAAKILGRLDRVGLGYLTIGQELTSLSGGERQRLKLAAQMGDSPMLLVLDEPTVGLHLRDVEQLIDLLDALVDDGAGVIVIEHHQAVMARADHIIDMGPGAGHDGGRVVFEGTPQQIVGERSTPTGVYLADYIEA